MSYLQKLDEKYDPLRLTSLLFSSKIILRSISWLTISGKEDQWHLEIKNSLIFDLNCLWELTIIHNLIPWCRHEKLCRISHWRFQKHSPTDNEKHYQQHKHKPQLWERKYESGTENKSNWGQNLTCSRSIRTSESLEL